MLSAKNRCKPMAPPPGGAILFCACFAVDEVFADFESLNGHDFSRAERAQNDDRLQPLRGVASSRWNLATVGTNWVIFPITLSA